MSAAVGQEPRHGSMGFRAQGTSQDCSRGVSQGWVSSEARLCSQAHLVGGRIQVLRVTTEAQLLGGRPPSALVTWLLRVAAPPCKPARGRVHRESAARVQPSATSEGTSRGSVVRRSRGCHSHSRRETTHGMGTSKHWWVASQLQSWEVPGSTYLNVNHGWPEENPGLPSPGPASTVTHHPLHPSVWP